MENFTPYSALIGGGFIGLSAVLFMLLHGRIAGISGMLAGLLVPVAGEWRWRLAFVLGIMAGPTVFSLMGGQIPAISFPVNGSAGLIVAGLLVGFGARLGGGCTSGHGVCGVSRLSTRSMVATGVFMCTGFATVYAIRHLIGA